MLAQRRPGQQRDAERHHQQGQHALPRPALAQKDDRQGGGDEGQRADQHHPGMGGRRIGEARIDGQRVAEAGAEGERGPPGQGQARPAPPSHHRDPGQQAASEAQRRHVARGEGLSGREPPGKQEARPADQHAQHAEQAQPPLPGRLRGVAGRAPGQGVLLRRRRALRGGAGRQGPGGAIGHGGRDCGRSASLSIPIPAARCFPWRRPLAIPGRGAGQTRA